MPKIEVSQAENILLGDLSGAYGVLAVSAQPLAAA